MTLIFSLFFGLIAVKAAPANNAFIDDNFYQCIIGTYNSTNSTNYDDNYVLTDEELSTITSIGDVANPNSSLRDVCKNIKDISGIKKLTNLNSLMLGLAEGSNKLDMDKLDLSKNNELKSIRVRSAKINELYLNNSLEEISFYLNDINSIYLEDYNVKNNISLFEYNSKIENIYMNKTDYWQDNVKNLTSSFSDTSFYDENNNKIDNIDNYNEYYLKAVLDDINSVNFYIGEKKEEVVPPEKSEETSSTVNNEKNPDTFDKFRFITLLTTASLAVAIELLILKRKKA